MSTNTKNKPKTVDAAAPEAMADNGGMEALSPAEGDNLDKVRNILFGAQSREYERQLTNLQQHVERELSTMKETMRRRFDELQTFVKEEDDALNKRLVAEQKKREDGITEQADALKALNKALKAGLAELDEKNTEGARTLRQRILEQSKELSDEMQHRFDTLSSLVRDENTSMRDEKADRQALADLFEEMSSRLRGDFKLPMGG